MRHGTQTLTGGFHRVGHWNAAASLSFSSLRQPPATPSAARPPPPAAHCRRVLSGRPTYGPERHPRSARPLRRGLLGIRLRHSQHNFLVQVRTRSNGEDDGGRRGSRRGGRLLGWPGRRQVRWATPHAVRPRRATAMPFACEVCDKVRQGAADAASDRGRIARSQHRREHGAGGGGGRGSAAGHRHLAVRRVQQVDVRHLQRQDAPDQHRQRQAQARARLAGARTCRPRWRKAPRSAR